MAVNYNVFTFKRIKSKFIFVLTLISILFTVSLISIIYIQERKQLFNVTINSSLEISKLHSQRIGSLIESNVIILKNLITDNKVILGDKNYIKSKLKLLKNNNTLFANAAYVSESGNISFINDDISLDISDKQYFKNMKAMQVQYVISEPFISKISNKPIFVIGVPIVSNGYFKGGIAVSIYLDTLSKIIEHVKINNNSFGWITNSKGLFIAHPNRKLILNASIDNAIDSGYKGSSGYGEYYDEIQNKNKVYTYSSIPYSKGWTLFVTTFEEDLFKEMNYVLRNIFILSVAMLAIFIFIIIRITDRITRPLNKLIIAVKESQNKNFKKIELKETKDEVGQLVGAYNKMTSEISMYTKGLEDLVEKRTCELNLLNKKLSKDNENLYNIATKDPLTGLLNRRAVNQIIEKEMHRHFRYNSPVSMMIIDIDHFKSINDTYGHDVGDKILIELSELILNKSRGSDTVSRWGGEEFVVLAPHTSSEGACIAGEKLRKSVESHEFINETPLTISIGISTYKLNETFDCWFKRSDKALYIAKKSGRNMVVNGEEN